MTLETIYFISQILAALGIMASLIFVGIQVRMGRKQAEESERVVRGQVLQHIAAEHRQHALTLLAHPEIHRCLLEATDPADMTEDNRLRVSIYCYASLHLTQNIYFQNRKGLLDTQIYESYLPVILSFLSTPAGWQYWEKRRGVFDAGFAEMINQRFTDGAPLGIAIQDKSAVPQDVVPESDREPDT